VANLGRAIDYAVERVTSPDHGWEGAGVLVLGPAQVIARARRRLLTTG
jgi:hypothetical protein